MYTKMGDQIVYENMRLGVTKEEGEEDRVFLAFTDEDNEETHLFPLAISKVEDYIGLVRQAVAGKKIEIATPGDMPRA